MSDSKYQDIENLDQQLREAQERVTRLEAEIAEMKKSKFWKLRELWFKIKPDLSRLKSQNQEDNQEDVSLIPTINYTLPQSLPRHKLSILLIVEERIEHCFRYRVNQKIEQLQHSGYQTSWVSWRELENARYLLQFYHIVIFYRVPAWRDVIALIEMAKALKKIVIFDIDDLVFAPEWYPEPFESYQKQLSKEEYQGLVEGVKLYQEALSHCDFAIGSTPPLKTAMAEIVGDGNAFYHRNGLDNSILSFIEAPPIKCKRDYLSILYGSGTKTHDADFELIASAIAQLFKRYSHLRLTIIGYLNIPPVLKPYHSRIDRIPFLTSTEAYWQFLAQADINIAPLTSSKFNDCKSEIKWLEAAILGVPSVVSATLTYREALEDGTDAFLAANPQEWEEKLKRLILDANLRHDIAEKARKKALQDYSPQALSEQLQYILTDTIDLATAVGIVKSQPNKKRLLLVNVLYPPQSLGGATAVVKNTVDHLQQHYPDSYEIFVFTTDWDKAEPYQLRHETVDGVYVTRISVPLDVDVEWRYQDFKIYKYFAKYLQTIQPDLIHFHCVQRLTASTLEAAADFNIPFFVTLHDAWWLGDCQFLVNKKGKPCDPHLHDPLIAARYSDNVTLTLKRQRYLATQLKKAQQLLAVSNSQAELYRQNGFLETSVSRNGIPPMPRTLHLGYAGGICTHKGYYLLQQAIEDANLQNTSLMVIDLSNLNGETRWEQWGSTTVQFIPKLPQERMEEFYSRIDVLVAPSICPESFGLISREATLAGVWVVASDVGALAEDIEPGVHGDIFSPDHPEELVAILQKLDRDPNTYQQPIPVEKTTHIRTLGEQVEELHQLYHE